MAQDLLGPLGLHWALQIGGVMASQDETEVAAAREFFTVVMIYVVIILGGISACVMF